MIIHQKKKSLSEIRSKIEILEKIIIGTKNLKIRENPGIIGQYSSLYEYWESEVYIMPQLLSGLDSDYILINLAIEKLPEENIMPFYILNQRGGDETKVFWFAKIAGLPVTDYYNSDFQSYSDKFWNDTLLGSLIPLTPILYVNPDNPEISSETYKEGYVGIYIKDIKFPFGGKGPFELVYAPLSYDRTDAGPMVGPVIYKINKDYNPNQ